MREVSLGRGIATRNDATSAGPLLATTVTNSIVCPVLADEGPVVWMPRSARVSPEMNTGKGCDRPETSMSSLDAIAAMRTMGECARDTVQVARPAESVVTLIQPTLRSGLKGQDEGIPRKSIR